MFNYLVVYQDLAKKTHRLKLNIPRGINRPEDVRNILSSIFIKAVPRHRPDPRVVMILPIK